MSVLAVSQKEQMLAHQIRQLNFRLASMCTRRVDVEKDGPTRWCLGCQNVTKGRLLSCIVTTHSGECRERMEGVL